MNKIKKEFKLFTLWFVTFLFGVSILNVQAVGGAKGINNADVVVNWTFLSPSEQKEKVQSISIEEIENSDLATIRALLNKYGSYQDRPHKEFLTVKHIKAIINFGLQKGKELKFSRDFDPDKWLKYMKTDHDVNNQLCVDLDGKYIYLDAKRKFHRRWLIPRARYDLWKFASKKFGDVFFEDKGKEDNS